MDQVKKIFAGIAGVGVLLLALYVAAFLFVILLIVGGCAAVYLHFKGGKLRKEFERQQAQRGHTPPETIDAEYVVVEDEPLDHTREPRA